MLWTIPGPTEAWASIIGHVAWPSVTLFLILRYKTFLRRYLTTIADRLETDHVKFGWFEVRAQDQVIVLDPAKADKSSTSYDSDDVNRIERMFEFIADNGGFEALRQWAATAVGTGVDFDDFLTGPEYATQRAKAFAEVKGLVE